MSRHRIEDGGNSPADIIKRIERARRADSTREGIARAYRRLDEALTKATDKMCEIGLLPASTAPARASPAPTGDSTTTSRPPTTTPASPPCSRPAIPRCSLSSPFRPTRRSTTATTAARCHPIPQSSKELHHHVIH